MHLCHNAGVEPVFWQNTLPLMVTILVAVGAATAAGWISNSNLSKRLDDLSKRIDDTNSSLSKRLDETNSNLSKRLDDIIVRLGRIEVKLDDHQERIARLEERTSPIHRN